MKIDKYLSFDLEYWYDSEFVYWRLKMLK